MGAFGLIWLIRIFVLRCHHNAELVSASMLLCIVLFQGGGMERCYDVASLSVPPLNNHCYISRT